MFWSSIWWFCDNMLRIIQSSSIRARYWVLARMLWRVMCIKFIARLARSHAIDILAYARVGACVPSCMCLCWYIAAVGSRHRRLRNTSSKQFVVGHERRYHVLVCRRSVALLSPPAARCCHRASL